MDPGAIAHMENSEMNYARFPHLRTVKFAPAAVFFIFLITNLTGFYFSPAFAPTVDAKSVVESESEFIPLDMPQSGDHELDLIIMHAGERAGVDPRFIHAVIQQESRYDADAKSPVGARGLMQLMPDTGKRFHCTDLTDEKCNVEAGTKYLAWLLKRFNGDVSLTLAAYNAGEGSVDKYKGIPPYHETENYVKKIVANYGKTFHPVVSPEETRTVFHLTADDANDGVGSE